MLKFSGDACGLGWGGQSSVHLLGTWSDRGSDSPHSAPGCKGLLDGAPKGFGGMPRSLTTPFLSRVPEASGSFLPFALGDGGCGSGGGGWGNFRRRKSCWLVPREWVCREAPLKKDIVVMGCVTLESRLGPWRVHPDTVILNSGCLQNTPGGVL